MLLLITIQLDPENWAQLLGVNKFKVQSGRLVRLKKKLLKIEGSESNLRGYRYWFRFINVPRSQTLYMAPFAAISLTLLIITITYLYIQK